MKKVKVLQCINGLGSGGAEKDIINWMIALHKENIYFDFLIRTNDIFYKKIVEKYDGKIYIVKSFPKFLLKNILETASFFKEHHGEYDAVHVHGNSLMYIIPLVFATRYNVPIRIFHIHSVKTTTLISRIMHEVNSKLLKKYANQKIGCSKKALDFAHVKDGLVIKNMINPSQFYPMLDPTTKIKEKYCVNHFKNIYIHIGRFLPVKNHEFLLDVFNEIVRIDSSSCLLLIGVGPLMEHIKTKTHELKLNNNIKFVGETTNINELLNISDLMIFPSLYEGIPLTMIEAQATKTKIFASDKINPESCISPYVKFYSLDRTPSEWAKEIIEFKNTDIECDIEECFRKADYDFTTEVKKLSKIYRREN